MELVKNIHIYSDRRYVIDFAIRQKNGANADWSSYTNTIIRFVVKRNVDDADSAAVIHKSTVSGITSVTYNPVKGKIELTKNNTANSNLPYGRYIWELYFECDELDRVQVAFGIMQVTESVIKNPSNLPAEA